MATLAKKWFRQGKAKGIAKGEAKGEAKGIAKVIRNSFKEGLSIDTIRRITGLPEVEINRLLEKYKHSPQASL